MTRTHRAVFLKEVKQAFPEIRDSLNAEHGLLHCEMHVFCKHVQTLIDSGNKEKLIKGFKIAEKHFMNGNNELINAIAVSFLEHLNFEDGKVLRKWAYEYLPATMRTAYNELTS